MHHKQEKNYGLVRAICADGGNTFIRLTSSITKTPFVRTFQDTSKTLPALCVRPVHCPFVKDCNKSVRITDPTQTPQFNLITIAQVYFNNDKPLKKIGSNISEKDSSTFVSHKRQDTRPLK